MGILRDAIGAFKGIGNILRGKNEDKSTDVNERQNIRGQQGDETNYESTNDIVLQDGIFLQTEDGTYYQINDGNIIGNDKDGNFKIEKGNIRYSNEFGTYEINNGHIRVTDKDGNIYEVNKNSRRTPEEVGNDLVERARREKTAREYIKKAQFIEDDEYANQSGSVNIRIKNSIIIDDKGNSGESTITRKPRGGDGGRDF
jgi:hypothetical protein